MYKEELNPEMRENRGNEFAYEDVEHWKFSADDIINSSDDIEEIDEYCEDYDEYYDDNGYGMFATYVEDDDDYVNMLGDFND